MSVALVTQHAKRIGRIMSFVAHRAVSYFFYINLQTAGFSEKVFEHKMCL